MKLFTPFLLLVALFTSQNVLANDPFHWDFINVEINLQENGDLLVKETQLYVFDTPYNEQRFRWIPLDGIDDITDISVTDSGKPLDFQTSIEKNQRWIKWTKAINTPVQHLFVLSYRVIGGGLDILENGDRLHWNAIFEHHAVPINKAKVTVTLPTVLTGQIQSYQGATAKKLNDRTVEFVSDQPLPAGQGLGVSVTFTHGVIKVNKWQNLWMRLMDKF